VTVDTPPRPTAPTGVRRLDRDLVALGVGALLLVPLPLVLPASQQGLAVRVLQFALLGVAWNVMGGFAGLFSFGHAAYFGIGAYTGAYLLVHHGVSPWLGMVAGAALAAAFGLLTGFLSFRYKLRGAYFALATFAFAEMLRLISIRLGLVNKAVGINIPLARGSSWAKLQFTPDSPNYFWIALGLVVLAVGVNIALLRSRSGQYVVAIREDELAATSLGVRALRYKLLAVAISAALTAVAGVFYVQYTLFVNPDLAFGSSVSIQAIVPAVVGGVGTIWGPVVGAAILGPLADSASAAVRNPPAFLQFLQGRAGLDVMLYAALLIVIILFLPRGVYGWVRTLFRRRLRSTA